MSKSSHEPKHSDASRVADRGSDAYIGRHRERNDVSRQGSGWAVGRGVDPQDVIDHTRNA
jgi:hypothetical protein